MRFIAPMTFPFCVVASVAFLSGVGSVDTNHAKVSCDGVNSSNIVEHLHPGPAHPLVGFWKDHCDDAFGLAIDQAGDGLYSISFCGPGGCFEVGSYRPNSSIVNDPNYRIVNDDVIEVLGRDGFTTYQRCTSKASLAI
jgi:hypothetical protein